MTKILAIVRALYGYIPETASPQELSFVEDELLLIIDNSTDDWWYAERFALNTAAQYKDRSDPLSWDDSKHAHTSSDADQDTHHIEWDDDQSSSTYGWIPSNYVQEAECQFIASCLYDFDPDIEDDEVSLQAGNQVLVYEAVSDPDWWLVKNHQDQYGWVPSNYLGLGSNQNDMIKEQENIFSELASKSIQLIDDSIKKPFEQKAKKDQEEKIRKQEEERNKKEQEHKKKEEEKQRKEEEEEKKKKKKEEEKIRKQEEERNKKEQEHKKKEEEKKKEIPKPKTPSPEPIESINKLSNINQSPIPEQPKIPDPPIVINPPSIATPLDSIPPPIKERKIQPPPILPRKKQALPETIPVIEQPPILPKKKSGLLEELKTDKPNDIVTIKNDKDLKLPELPPKKEQKPLNDVLPKKSLPNRPKKLPNSHKPDPSRTRIWKDKSGMYSVEAQFISISYDTDPVTVVLCKLNGNKVSIPLNKLSDEDSVFIKSKMKEVVPDKKVDESLGALIKSVKNVSIPETKQEQKSLPAPLHPKTATPNPTGYTESTLANIQQFLAKNSQQKQQAESCLVPSNQAINNVRSANPYQQNNPQQMHDQQAVSLLHIQNIHQQQQLQAQQRLLAQQQQEQQQLKNQFIQLQQHTQQQNAIIQMKQQQEQMRRQQEQQNALLRQMTPQYPHQMGMIPPTAPIQQATAYQYRNASFSNQMMPFNPQQPHQPQQFPVYNQPPINPYRPPYPRWNGQFQ